jgi:hypothetical protein
MILQTLQHSEGTAVAVPDELIYRRRAAWRRWRVSSPLRKARPPCRLVELLDRGWIGAGAGIGPEHSRRVEIYPHN